ncbi:MAG: 7,8-didemethyl-8-hydroxy-5-deazariboflavin synthase, partial [Chloroflexi bacterium]|nr:7,8-didemethyl-8-hydroxy-5-deazariboflavin synthase [Chloroflexota bacterium]
MESKSPESGPAVRQDGVDAKASHLVPLDELLEAAAQGATIGEGESAALVGVDGSRLKDLCAVAAQLRNQGKGTTVTFSPKVFIPLTRLCRDFCGYCTFRQDPSSTVGDLFMTPEAVLDVARAGQRLGCTEALFTLGERPEQRYPEAKAWLERRGFSTTLEYLAHVCKLVAQETQMLPHANPGTMSR